MATQNPTAFEVYNETIRALKAHCKRYLYILDTGKYEKKGGTTKLDRHRASLCLKSIEDILEKIKINGDLPNNNYMRIAMIHAHRYLRKLQKLCEDVSRTICSGLEKDDWNDIFKINIFQNKRNIRI